MKIEMHVHTKYSKDSIMGFASLYRQCKRNKIDVIAITEHNNICGAKKFEEFCSRHNTSKYKLQVIIGEEIFSKDGEIIGLYLKSRVKQGLSAAETIRQIKAQGGLVCVPHPYDEKRYQTVLREDAIAENQTRIDCMEIHNGRNRFPLYDKKQEALAKKYGIRSVIGSDAHTCIEIGRNYMICDSGAISSAEELLNALNSMKLYKAECLKISYFITKIVKGIKLLRMRKFHELYRIIIRKITGCEHGCSIQNK